MSDKPKKKFRNTRVGKFLTKKLPSILGVAGDILPDAGLLNMVKSLIEKAPFFTDKFFAPSISCTDFSAVIVSRELFIRP